MKEYHQAVLLKASGNPILVGYECRPHTIPVKKSTEMKELTLQDLDDGVIITMPDNSRYKLHRTNFIIDMSEWSAALNKLQITLEGRPQPIIKQPTQPKAEQENTMKKDFTKADLRSGHKVKCRNGEIFTVFLSSSYKDQDVLSGNSSWTNLDDMSNDLTARFNSDFDIIEVSANPVYYLAAEHTCNLVWKREDKSPEQIAYEQLQAQIADEETRHNESMKALREQAEKLKPKQ